MTEPLINPNEGGELAHSDIDLKDLVFNPETGDFEEVSKGAKKESMEFVLDF